jgi:ribosomal protein S18 acetylase RimI-like enzyme
VARVREATAGDASSVAALLGELGYPAEPESARGRLERLLADPESAVWLAVRGGVAVGLVAMHVVPVLERDGATCRITALVVSAAARRGGVARALVERVEAEAVERGCDRLEVTSSGQRDAAHAFYRGFGFTERPERFVKGLRSP